MTSRLTVARESGRMYARRILSLGLIYLLLACHVVSFAPFLDAIAPGTLLVARWIVVSTVIVFGVVSLIYGIVPRSLILFALSVLILVCSQILYSYNFDQPVTLGALAPYLAFGAVVIFSETRVSIQDIVKAAFHVTIFYLLVYAIFHDYFLGLTYAATDFVNQEGPGKRLMLPLSYAIFAVAYIISNIAIDKRRWIIYAPLLIIVLYCLWRANSRAFNVVSLIGIAIALIVPLRRQLRLTFGGATIAIMAYTCLSVPTSINPFNVLDFDRSGHYRVVEYEIGQDILREHPIAGMGIPSSLERDTAIYVRDPNGPNAWDIITLYAGDVGAVGLWLNFGLHGLLLALYGTWLCFSFRMSPLVPLEIAETLRTTGSVIGAYGIIAPTIFGGSGTMLFALIVATHLDARTRVRGEAISAAKVEGATTSNAPA